MKDVKIPAICKDCKDMVICRAGIVIREYGGPVATCNSNLRRNLDDKDWYGVRELCEDVLRRISKGEAAICGRFDRVLIQVCDMRGKA